MRGSAQLDERICRGCLKSLEGADDLRMLLCADQILCLECRRALHAPSWLAIRKWNRQVRELFASEALRRKEKPARHKPELFVLYEENEVFQARLERYEKLQDVHMAPLFLADQNRALQFLREYDLWLDEQEHALFLKRSWSPLALILESAGLSSSMPFDAIRKPLQLRPTWKPRSSRPGCLVLKSIKDLPKIRTLLPLLPALPRALFILSGG